MRATRREAMGAGLAAGGLALLPGAAPAGTCDIAAPLDRAAAVLLADLPDTAVYNGVPQALDGGPLARRMDDWSPAGIEAFRGHISEQAEALEAVTCAGDATGELQLAAAREILGAGTRTASIGYGRPNPLWFSGHVPYVLAPVGGPHVDVPNTMMAQQSVSTPAAVDAWCEKLEGFGHGFEAVGEKVRSDWALGCRPPAVLLDKTLPILDAFGAGPADQHPLIVSLRERTGAAGLDQRTRESAEKRAIAAIDGKARPAFRRLRETMAKLAPDGRMEAGVWAQPDGDELYAANVRTLGDTTLTPQQIHAVGLSETRRITGEMDALLRAHGYTKGSVSARATALRQEPRFAFPATDAGRAAALDYARALVRGAEAQYAKILPADLYPRARLEVRRVPPATEAGAPGAYSDPPPLDGVSPGIYWLNMRDMAAVNRVALPTLTYHEAVPGHFTAGAIAAGLGGQPLLLKLASFNAYNEGWALYAERLMWELGAYRADPWGDVGRLNDELFRAVRLVVDTGLHAMRWTREQAIGFMTDATGSTESEIVAEIERYMAWPGQALGYKLGQLRLLELRAGMKKRLGARFDLRRFHRAVLGHGNLPFDLVSQLVARA